MKYIWYTSEKAVFLVVNLRIRPLVLVAVKYKYFFKIRNPRITFSWTPHLHRVAAYPFCTHRHASETYLIHLWENCTLSMKIPTKIKKYICKVPFSQRWIKYVSLESRCVQNGYAATRWKRGVQDKVIRTLRILIKYFHLAATNKKNRTAPKSIIATDDC